MDTQKVFLPHVLHPNTQAVVLKDANGLDLDCYYPEGGHLIIENINGGHLVQSTGPGTFWVRLPLGHYPEDATRTCLVSLRWAKGVVARGPYGIRKFGDTEGLPDEV